MYILEIENSNFKMFNANVDVLKKFMEKVEMLRKEKHEDAERWNESFGYPCDKDWDELNKDMVNCTPENGDEFGLRIRQIQDKENELFELHVDKMLEKNIPEWYKFFKHENSAFGDIRDEFYVLIYKIKELTSSENDLTYDDGSTEEVERYYLYRT